MEKIRKSCKKKVWSTVRYSGHQIAVRRRFSKAFRRWDSRTRSTYNWIFAIKQGTNQAVYSSAPALTMRWQTDIDSIRRRLKNYSQLQTTLHPSFHFFLPLFPPYHGTLFRYLSLWRFPWTRPSRRFLSAPLYPSKLFLNFVSPLNRRNISKLAVPFLTPRRWSSS